MINYTLQNLTNMIKKCCYSLETNSPTDRFPFAVDFSKLENMLKQKNTNLHVIALDKSLKSKPITVNDLQLVTEYIHDQKNFDIAFDGRSHVLPFMLFSTINEEGEVTLYTNPEDGSETDNNDNLIPMTDKEIFNACNVEVSEDLVINIMSYLPCYRIIVIHSFNEETERYEYKVNIRSNFAMVALQKHFKEVAENSAE